MSNVLDSEVPQWILRALKAVDGSGSGLIVDSTTV